MSKILGCRNPSHNHMLLSWHPFLPHLISSHSTPLSLALPAYCCCCCCCYCLRCAHVKSNKFNNAYTYGMKAEHTFPAGGTWSYAYAKWDPKQLPARARSGWLAGWLTGRLFASLAFSLFSAGHAPRRISTTAALRNTAQRRRCRLITMQIWSQRIRNICLLLLGVCVRGCVCVCCVVFRFPLHLLKLSILLCARSLLPPAANALFTVLSTLANWS